MDQIKPCPVIWALGNKGYFLQTPMISILTAQLPVLAVTNANNINLQNYIEQNHLLYSVDVPSNWKSTVKFFFTLPKARAQLMKKLQQHASAIHIVMCSPWDIFFLGIATKVGVPVIVTIHDAVQHKGEESFVMDYLRDWCISKADLVTVLSYHVAQTLRENRKFKKPLKVILNGWVTITKPALSARKFPMTGATKLLFHGRIHAYKGLDLLLDAMLLLQKSGRKYFLTIAGAGDISAYQEKISRVSNIHILNSFLAEEQIHSLLTEHDISVMPYIEASQSGVARDVLWAALPAIVTPVGALPKQFTHKTDALVTKTVSASALAQEIERLSTDRALYESLSAGFYNTYKKTGPDQAAKQWKDIYMNIQNFREFKL